MPTSKNTLLIGTRKGLVIYQKAAAGWEHAATHFTGIPVSIAWADERNGKWWALLDHGHWGHKLHCSTDQGKSWDEKAAPAFDEGEMYNEDEKATVQYLWAMAHGGRNGKLYIGTVPGGLFESGDDGETFLLNRGLWDHPTRQQWFGGGMDHPGIHSVVVDPRNSDHIHVGISCGGVYFSADGGRTWEVRNNGLHAEFLPDPDAEVGHDPHLLVQCPSNPDVLWQQNHCGIFKSTDGGRNWEDVSQKDGPANFGFAIAVAADNPDRAWVVPAHSDGIRVAIDGALCVSRTDDGGKTWQAFRSGLPQENCFDIVYRHALAVDKNTVLFGTTTGNLFLSEDGGEHFEALSNYLPMVYSVWMT